MQKRSIGILFALVLILMIPFHADAVTTKPGLIPILDCSTLGHKWEVVSGLSATCDSPAQYTYECTRCDATKKETEGEALGHTWVDDGTVYPDCENPGLEKMHCSFCNKEWKNTIPALGHIWKDEGIITEPTCEKKGSRLDKCETCGKELVHEIEATGHDWKNIRIIKEPTCTATGKAESQCRDCGKEGTRTLQKAPHTVGEWTVTKKATETSKGTRTATCEVCGKKVKESFEFVPGDVAVYTTIGKVNLRAGAGTSKKQVNQVAKKGTYLGQLRESTIDKNDAVWFKIKYKNKVCWVMAKYAEAIVDTSDLTKERLPDGGGSELTTYFLKSLEPVGEALGMEDISAEEDLEEWSNGVIYISGHHYVEHINLTGEGYSIFGVKVGDKIKDARRKLDSKNLIQTESYTDQYTYRIPCLPDALSADDSGCCASLVIIVNDESRIEEIQLQADVPAEW